MIIEHVGEGGRRKLSNSDSLFFKPLFAWWIWIIEPNQRQTVCNHLSQLPPTWWREKEPLQQWKGLFPSKLQGFLFMLDSPSNVVHRRLEVSSVICLVFVPSAACSFDGLSYENWRKPSVEGEITWKRASATRHLWTRFPTNHFDVTCDYHCVRSHSARLVPFLLCVVCLAIFFRPLTLPLLWFNIRW